jgi:hypothetical protein
VKSSRARAGCDPAPELSSKWLLFEAPPRDTPPLMTMGTHQSQIAEMMERGATLGEVEEDLISDAPLDSDEKAGLWLFAWALTRRANSDAG